jgi:leucyl-tRNA synthetase
MVLAESFFKKNADDSTTWYNPADVELTKDNKGKIISAHHPVAGALELGGAIKMSKSKNNGVDPQTAVDRYGADTVRLFAMFAAPPEQTLEWHDSGVEGASRFLRRFWKTAHGHLQVGEPGPLDPETLDNEQKQLRRKTHETIAKVSSDFGQRQTFNTAVAAAMELLNEVNNLADRATPQGLAVEREALTSMTLLLAPIAPHICHSLWAAFGNSEPVVDAPWPTADESAMVKDSLVYPVQVNGKIRAKLEVAASASPDEILAAAKADANVQKFTDGKEIKMAKVIPGKLVTIAVK